MFRQPSPHPNDTYSNQNIQDFAQSNSQIRHFTKEQKIWHPPPPPPPPPRTPKTLENYIRTSTKRQGRKENVSHNTPFLEVLKKNNRLPKNVIKMIYNQARKEGLSRDEARERVRQAQKAASEATGSHRGGNMNGIVTLNNKRYHNPMPTRKYRKSPW